MTQMIKDNTEKELSDKIDQEKRRKNLIIFNISEPEDLEPGAREENDRTFCENMFVEKLNVDNVKIKKVIRIGKKRENSGRPRPLLVWLEQDHEPWVILKNARKLNDVADARFKKIRIAKDLTQKQQQVENELYSKLRRNREQGEDGWYINRGRLIRGREAGGGRYQCERDGGGDEEN